eukprot:scaffold131341_cov31-Tisochrysis_lutea.AAC.3
MKGIIIAPLILITQYVVRRLEVEEKLRLLAGGRKQRVSQAAAGDAEQRPGRSLSGCVNCKRRTPQM